MQRSVVNQRAAQQINGREGETATFLSAFSIELGVARWRFRPTSSQTFGVSSVIQKTPLLREKKNILFVARLTFDK